MEEEIDLRPYILTLLRYWKLIIGAAILAAGSAFVISSLQPKTYTATALVIVTRPRYELSFDPRFETVGEIQIVNKLYPELAQSDDVVSLLFETVAQDYEIASRHSLRQMLTADSGSDPSLVRLEVQANDPQAAAQIANTWATLFINQINQLGGNDAAQVELFERQLAEAATELEAAEQALIAYEARNRTNLLNTQLSFYRSTQADYLQSQREIADLIQDIVGLQNRLEARTIESPVEFADDLTALLLQIKTFDANVGSLLQLQIDSTTSFSDRSVSGQITFLGELITILQDKSQELDVQLAALEPLLLGTQRDLQESQIEAARLERAATIAQETYLTLARKVEETRIAVQSAGEEVQLASQASSPERPSGPRRMLNTAIAGMLGLMLSVGWVLVAEWWRQGQVSPA